MRGAAKVPFTQGEEEKLISLNVPLSMRTYLQEHGIKDTVIRAVSFDRELGDLLGPIQTRVDAWAAAHNLSRTQKAAEIVAALMEKGLEAWEAEQKASKKK